jgi:hypothetical protein
MFALLHFSVLCLLTRRFCWKVDIRPQNFFNKCTGLRLTYLEGNRRSRSSKEGDCASYTGGCGMCGYDWRSRKRVQKVNLRKQACVLKNPSMSVIGTLTVRRKSRVTYLESINLRKRLSSYGWVTDPWELTAKLTKKPPCGEAASIDETAFAPFTEPIFGHFRLSRPQAVCRLPVALM